jgi:membrane fusion protein, multidrug efflux system
MKKALFGLVVALLGIVIGVGAQFYYSLLNAPAPAAAGGSPPAAAAPKAAAPVGSGEPSKDAAKDKDGKAAAPVVAGAQPISPAAPAGAAGASKGGGAPGGGGGGGAPVEIATPEMLNWPKSVTSVGTLRSDESVTIRSEVTGRIQAINFKEGQRVARGQMLVKLDDTVLRAELEQAKANQRLAKAKFDRAAELKDRGFISGQAKDEAENAQRVADASVQLVEARLARLTIASPFAGTAGLRLAGVGDYLREGQDVVTIEKTDVIKVDFKVPEIFLGATKTGQPLQIALDAFPKQSFGGTVIAVSPQLDAAGRAINLRAQMANKNGVLKPGMFARVRLLLAENADAITIPEQSLAPQGEDQFVFRVVEGRAVRTKVEIGQRRDGRVEIVSGIAPTDRVVAAGWQRIRDGAPVRPVSAGGPPGGGGAGGAGKGGEGKPGEMKAGEGKGSGAPAAKAEMKADAKPDTKSEAKKP